MSPANEPNLGIDLSNFDSFSVEFAGAELEEFDQLIIALESWSRKCPPGWPVGLDRHVTNDFDSWRHFAPSIKLREGYVFNQVYGPPYIRSSVPIEYSLYFLHTKNRKLNIDAIKEVARLNLLSPSIGSTRMRHSPFTSGQRLHFCRKEQILERLHRFLFKFNSCCSMTGNAILDAIIFYVEFMVIHPLLDGNGRVGRVIFQHSLLRAGVMSAPICPIGALLVHHRPYIYSALLDLQLDKNTSSITRLFSEYIRYLLNGPIREVLSRSA